MLASRYRFHGYGSLNYVYRNGRTVRGGMISLKYCLNPRRKQSRISVVVGKKVEKRAVGRNRIRRRLYEVIRLQLPNIKEPHDIVVTVFDKQIDKLSYEELSQLVHKLLSQAQII